MALLKNAPGARMFARVSFSVLGVAMLAASPGTSRAGQLSHQPLTNFADLSIEELMNESVTSVSKKETPLLASPAAITVITPDEIRRLGIASLPEALRLVPGMDVARIGANETAVSVRGFNNVFANKLLALVDRRAIYSPSSAGVFWNSQDVVLEDLDRIEVIRGPGSTLWGANAVNGVINIITKSARETQGTLVSTSVGTEERPTATIRHGGLLGPKLYYRVYAKYFDRDSLTTPAGTDARDGWNSTRGGFRLDYEPSAENNFTLQGDLYEMVAGKDLSQLSLTPPFSQTSNVRGHNRGRNLLSRWTRTFSETSQLTVQAYYDYLSQDVGSSIDRANTFDFDLEHHVALSDRNDISWGFGYRDTEADDSSTFGAIWAHEDHRLRLFNVFAQDDLSLVRGRLHLILGSKLEHNNLTGLEVEPGVRLLWTPTSRQTVWTAVSHAVRTPSFVERDARLNLASGPGFLSTIFGNPSLDSEKLTAYELGYRIAPLKQLSFELAAYYNAYKHLVVNQENPTVFETSPSPPHALASQTWRNAADGETYGAEFSAQWQVLEGWRLAGSYTWFRTALAAIPLAETTSPEHQFQIHSSLDLPHQVELNAAAYYVSSINTPFGRTTNSVPSYLRLDLGLVFHPGNSFEVGVWGVNLLDNRHLEFTSPQSRTIAEIPRGVTGKLTWRF
jgi:iron complex outermembrane recepter protein